MKDLKLLIIDDEQHAISYLQHTLSEYMPTITQIETAVGAQSGIEMIQSFQPNLILLDIEMPHMNGFELLSTINTWNFGIIYTTAFDQYAIQAIRFSALDYLLKPIDPELLRQAILKYVHTSQTITEQNKRYKHLLENLSQKHKEDFSLAIPGKRGTNFKQLRNIIRIEADGNYSQFHFNDKSTNIVAKTLKEYSELLQQHGFIRIHKSHLINKGYINMYLQNGKIQLENNEILEVSRRRRSEVKKILGVLN